MPVHAIVTNVYLSIGIPGFELASLIKDLSWLLGPDELLSLLPPEPFFVVHGKLVLSVVELVIEIIGLLPIYDILLLVLQKSMMLCQMKVFSLT
jgi:hypothetical protein